MKCFISLVFKYWYAGDCLCYFRIYCCISLSFCPAGFGWLYSGKTWRERGCFCETKSANITWLFTANCWLKTPPETLEINTNTATEGRSLCSWPVCHVDPHWTRGPRPATITLIILNTIEKTCSSSAQDWGRFALSDTSGAVLLWSPVKN